MTTAMGFGLDYDAGQVECRVCLQLKTPDDETCACCPRCGGGGSLVSGLGAGKGWERVTCGACEGTGRAPVEADEGAGEEQEAA